jgi:hypothetical protein
MSGAVDFRIPKNLILNFFNLGFAKAAGEYDKKHTRIEGYRLYSSINPLEVRAASAKLSRDGDVFFTVHTDTDTNTGNYFSAGVLISEVNDYEFKVAPLERPNAI